MAAAAFEGVSCSVHGAAVLRDFSLTIPEGSAYGVIGPNGSGKSTILKLLATVVKPSSGRITVFDHDAVGDAAAVRRIVGYVPDAFGAYPGLKVREYLEFFAGAHKLRHATTTINELLALVELQAVERQYLTTLSRGMKQRLAIARALLHDPRLLLLDEPTFGLDVSGRRDILAVLRELHHLGKTLVVSSHLLEDVAQLTTDVAALSAGTLAAETSADELRQAVEGPRRMRLEVANDPRQSQAALSALDGVRAVEVEGQALTFLFNGGRYDLPDIVDHLVAHEVKIIRFAEESNDLELLMASLPEARQL